MNPWVYFEKAARVAARQDDLRVHRLGAVGLRSDGVLVTASNGAAIMKTPAVHAEARLCRKLGRDGVVFVARRSSNGYLLAKPCGHCQALLRTRKVRRVYFTVSDSEYGVLELH